jgi:hypothetical protein
MARVPERRVDGREPCGYKRLPPEIATILTRAARIPQIRAPLSA